MIGLEVRTAELICYRHKKTAANCGFLGKTNTKGLSQQLQYLLWSGISLGQHRLGGLLQNLSATQGSGFRGKVGIHNT